MKHKIGKELRLYRYEKGYTQEYVAQNLSISEKTYARIEQGKTDISLSTLIDITQLFGIDITKLLSKTTR